MPTDTTEADGSRLVTAARSRDAARTRTLLLEAGRRRFGRDGYAATTVRDIAADVGVNVALISRYFSSKEGLFEACLTRAVEELDEVDAGPRTYDDMVTELVRQVAALPGGERPVQLLLLLRSSGDEQADLIRRRTLRVYTERIAAMAGWSAEEPGTAHLLLGAQVALATVFGIALLRSSTGLEPIAAASEHDLDAPLRATLAALLPPPGRG